MRTNLDPRPSPVVSAMPGEMLIRARPRRRAFALRWWGLDARLAAAPVSLETLLVGLASIGLFGLYIWMLRYWLDLIDEGYFVYLASRVYHGDLPYRDFDTYYTPGIFYLFSATFSLLGVSIESIRILMAGMRVLCAVLLYGLTRRVAPWPFAILPFLAVAAVDPAPIFPEPHPSWPALAATLLVLELLVRHQRTERLRWLVLAGAAAGVAYFFKQNVGAFVAIGLGGYIFLRPRATVGRLLMAARLLYVIGLGLVVTLFLRPALDGYLAFALWLPVLATLALLYRRSRQDTHVATWTDGLRVVGQEGVLSGTVFVAVTLLWLIPLTLALGLRNTPFGLFVGAVNQGALILPIEPPPAATNRLALTALWLPIGLAAVAGWRLGDHGWRLGGAVLAMSAMAYWIPSTPFPRVPIVDDPDLYPTLTMLDRELGNVYIYLPALAGWAGLLALALLWRHMGARVGMAGPLPWYLLIGALVLLSLYPRVDAIHAMLAGPPLFVVGAWALARVHRFLVGHAHPAWQALVFVALLLVPAAAVAPHAYWRYVTIVRPIPWDETPPTYVPVGLERAPVLAPEFVADNVRGAVEFVRDGTPPGEPFFAYPAVPLFNFLADRPNPTRFDHYFPGALTPDDLVRVIADLDTRRPRYVLWDHAGVVYWQTDPTNRPISDYIWRCYQQVASFPPYLILERHACE